MLFSAAAAVLLCPFCFVLVHAFVVVVVVVGYGSSLCRFRSSLLKCVRVPVVFGMPGAWKLSGFYIWSFPLHFLV
jgi:hypothetical protein